ncbi:bifunctional folylpolyglutamate synthase/dihydrofolate synthase [Ethanoligenens harbinense]|uniref:tetrahydrofolate synthase n=1 Tax=Ethanoligenens harbinense (strain DSM 18485 / JCM 12961 / CGMCC 1.5033 / YUAN-3) TaxID=663278 RepID=E6U7K4_ETHHY|nr:folylpolyglutamate synthase/dihydrofolate synthase family protein [Ethanoligenens harbinense]ADU27027.1 FolC bifunctional protein [Ethanoligenens harbinense YUAN-3]AVQ96114.1 bifunctional folylpolyglutamate synthase/dihydrofolate synthase [Ethanoligenens harbinense YUAN-3]AYF38775.1 bifunctional folylpolyglutamate synthase/dihydrofolate synthase [Ethanoligenens harbinense]AYF41523.1 bifunctional folylpolyglutamate synthase/dihydrofolate synthase [Ethanoligenens harbinense]QCN92355.1 bifunct
MTYEEALAYIHSTLRFGIQPGLSRIARLLGRIGNPQEHLRFVHVAGTNGKGSTSAAIAAALRKAGLRTGLYISPYIEDFRERIQINGRYIAPGELAAELARLLPFLNESEGEHPTEFELITALAFAYFARQACDVAVLEVGLGGRFDATNVIPTPLISVITAISLDHTAVLGDTLGQIAFEKCGIIKPGGVTVTSPGQAPEALETITRICAERGNPLHIPQIEKVQIQQEGIDGTSLLYGGQPLSVPLCGRHQIANFLTAYEALRLLPSRGLDISLQNAAAGMADVRFPARLERLHDKPLVLLDGAHNAAGTAALADAVRRYLPGRPVTTVMGMLADKDYAAGVGNIAPLSARFIAVRPDSPRALDPRETARTASAFCANTVFFDDLGDAFADALAHTGAEGVLLICGSLYLAGPMRRLVRGHFSKCV